VGIDASWRLAYGFPPFDRMGRVTLWKNRPARR